VATALMLAALVGAAAWFSGCRGWRYGRRGGIIGALFVLVLAALAAALARGGWRGRAGCAGAPRCGWRWARSAARARR
jgi:putative ABC transport system permease protein